MADTFVVYDCSLVLEATGEWVTNLRDLLRAVQAVPGHVLEHHMLRCQMSDRFELTEFPNDLARWCWEDLDDHVTAERLGLIDPYRLPDLEALRRAIIDTLEARLWGAEHALQACRPGTEFHLVGSRLVAYETGMRLESPAALAEALPRMSLRSLFYHVHEARRRTGGATDDLSAWLESAGGDADLVRDIRAIDFYFLNLTQLREELLELFRKYFPAYQIPAGGAL